MLNRLRLAHRLLLIYMLSFVSVAVLAYSLIVEKNIAIEFAQREEGGTAYVEVVSDALLAVVDNDLGRQALRTSLSLQAHATAVSAAEAQFGRQLDTKALADRLRNLLNLLDADSAAFVERHALHMQAIATARALISRIGDNSNLILDPDLDTYYLMSVTVLRLPEFVASTLDLAHAAEGGESSDMRDRLLLAKGAFAATNSALVSDNTRLATSLLDQSALGDLQVSFARMQKAVARMTAELESTEISTAPLRMQVTARNVVGETGEYGRRANAQLARLLAQRIDRLNGRMISDLSLAGLVWLTALALILLIARQITGPIRQLAAVADRVRHGGNYDLRAPVQAGGEMGRLAEGLNLMLARLKSEAERERERVAFERTAAAQYRLLESIPVVISVTSNPSGQVLYSNASASEPAWISARGSQGPLNIFELLHPEDRAAFLEIFRISGQVDGFEARCLTPGSEPAWLLVAARRVEYQGEPARLDVYTPITERKCAEQMLARRNAVLNAISYAATKLIGTADWREAIPEFFARLGTAIDVSRIFLFEVHRDRNTNRLVQSCRFLWSAPGVESISDQGQLDNEPVDDESDPQIAEWFRRRREGETIRVIRSETRGVARKVFDDTSTLSMLSVPIMVDSEFWGSLGLDDCRSERPWDDSEVELLKTAAALIASAIGRALSEERIRLRDSKLVEAQRIANLGIWELDFNTNQVAWSDEGWRIFGLEPRIGGLWSHDDNLRCIHPNDRERVAAADAKARESQTPIDMEYRIIHADGTVRVLYERAEPFCDEFGRPTRLVGTVRDVTELKATEARLRESDERYELAARGADAGLFDWNYTTDHTYFSPRLLEILEMNEHNLGSEMKGLFAQFLPEDLVALQRDLKQKFAAQRRRFEFDVRWRKRDDISRWLTIRGLIVYALGQPARLVGSIRDITDRKRSQEELERQREALYRSEKMAMFGSLLAGVAHELNNPLSVVTGQVALLRETATDKQIIARAERIRVAADRCARIVRTFLSMARQRNLDPKPVEIRRMVDMAIELLSHQLRSANIRINLDFDSSVPVISADADQLHQVITNLIVNAMQAPAVAERPREISIGTRYDAQAGQVYLTVADNGPGIPQDVREKVFDPFFTTKPVGEGTGIGLSLCASIVRAHGGQITVSNLPSGGAEFTIALPLGVRSAGSREWSKTPDLPVGLKVLVVDDDHEVGETLREILTRYGHDTDIALDGVQGLRYAKENRYDLIFSDMRMPRLDGRGFYDELLRQGSGVVDSIAFITGDTLSVEVHSFLNQTGALHLEKPFQSEDVLRLIMRIMEKRKAKAESTQAMREKERA